MGVKRVCTPFEMPVDNGPKFRATTSSPSRRVRPAAAGSQARAVAPGPWALAISDPGRPYSRAWEIREALSSASEWPLLGLPSFNEGAGAWVT